MKKLILCIIIKGLFLINTALAQNNAEHSDNRLNAITLNAFGYSVFYSIQYERLFAIRNIGRFTGYASGLAGIGLSGTLFFKRPNISYLSFPHHLTYNIGFDPLRLETGIGGAVINGYKNQYFVLTGLRLHSLQKQRVQLRVYFQLPLTKSDEELFKLNGGWSIGINF
ncbi:MAG: hypothetical protein WD267_12035 [Balneolales bacterium]